MQRPAKHRSPRILKASWLPFLVLVLGCPHRSPVWSPDGTRLLLLGGTDGEEMDRPASRLWLVHLSGDGRSARASSRLRPPGSGPELRYLATAWIDDAAFVALTVKWEEDEAVEGSGALWKVSGDGKTWTRLRAPPPSAERTLRRNPAIVTGAAPPVGKRQPILAYVSGSEKVVAVSLDSGKVLLEMEPAEMVGPGPEGGFLVQRPDEATGGLELVALGGDLKERWTRGFGDLAREIGQLLGKARSEIVFNDTSTSIVAADGKTVGINLVFTDVSWNDGISGYHAIVSAGDGSIRAVNGTTGLPGRPSAVRAGSEYWAWAIVPSSRRNARTGTIRAFPVGAAGDGEKGEVLLEEIPKGALHGYGLSPDGKTFCAAVNGPVTRLLFYPVEGRKLTGAATEIGLE